MATYYWVGSNIDDNANTPGVPYNSWLNANNWVNSPDYPSSGGRGFVPAAGDTVFIDGANFTGTGAADTVTVSGRYSDPTMQFGGMGMIAATLTDTLGKVEAISTGVGMDNASTWTNTGGLDNEAGISLFSGSQLLDQGTDTIGVTNTLAEITVDGTGSKYSDSADVVDDGFIGATNGASIFIGGELTGTGALTVGGISDQGSADAAATLGAVELANIAVATGSDLTAGNVTSHGFSVGGGGTATVGSLAVANYLTVAGTDSDFTDSGALTFGSGAGSNTEIQISDGGTLSLSAGALSLGAAGESAALFLSGTGSKLAYTGPITLGSNGAGELELSAGATYATAGGLTLGNGMTGVGGITVSGANSSLGVTGALTATGSLLDFINMYSGGTLTATSLALGTDNTGTLWDLAEIGADALFAISGAATVGIAGLGTLESDGGTITVGSLAVATTTGTAGLYSSIAEASQSGGQLLVGGNATLDAATPLGTNDAGQTNGTWGNWAYAPGALGALSASDGGFISIGGTLTLQPTYNPEPRTDVEVSNGASMEVGGKSNAVANELVVDAAGLIIGHGTIDVGTDTAASMFDGSVVNNGTIEASSGTLTLNANISGGGTYQIDPNATLRLNGTVAEATHIVFGGTYDTTLALDQPSNFEATLTNFQQGDAISLPYAMLTPQTPQGTTVSYGDGTLSLAGVGAIAVTGPDPVPTFSVGYDYGVDGPRIETTPIMSLLDLAFATYKPATSASIDGYKLLTTFSPGSGFYAAAYVETNPDDPDPSIVISYRGTSLNQPADAIKNVLADASFLTGDANAMLQRYVLDASNFVVQVEALARKDYPDQSPLITLTGHSLGGALAQLVGEAGNFGAAGFDAPGSGGAIYNALGADLAPVVGQGGGGTDTNYRLSGDLVSEAGEQLGAVYTIASPYTADDAPAWLTAVNALNNHGVGIGGYQYAFQNLDDSSAYARGVTGPDLITPVQAAIQGPDGAALRVTLSVVAGVATVVDPAGGASFMLTEDSGSPTLSNIALPIFDGVAGYTMTADVAGAATNLGTVDPGTQIALPDGTDGVTFAPVDASGDPVTLDTGFFFSPTFATSGTFAGTLTASGGGTAGLPVTTASTVTLVSGAAPESLGIDAPTDAAYADPTDLAAEVTSLPTDATVYLADGATPVTDNELLTIAQLASLTASTTATAGESGSFGYEVSDPDFASADGTATIQVACFRAGTAIATPDGEVPVESLRVGDLVQARRVGVARIAWVGHRRVDCRQHPRPWDVWPIRVQAGAFAPRRPRRDLFLSPDHAVLVAGLLIPIRYLVNGRSIAQQQVESVLYYHVELAAHDVVLAEGLPCETYLDTGNRHSFADNGTIGLHPDFARPFAPLRLAGKPVTAARRRLLRRAAMLGHAITSDPALMVLADGTRLVPHIDGARWRVCLPPGTTDIRLVSRVWVPAHAHADESDARELGVAIARLSFDGRPISLDSPALSDGWHAAEPDWRWTSGNAMLPVSAVRALAFEVAMAGAYWAELQNGRKTLAAA
jgi:T5SS/PEP-CTERM-associated repeat protein